MPALSPEARNRNSARQFVYRLTDGSVWGVRVRGLQDGTPFARWESRGQGFPPLYNADRAGALPPGSTVYVTPDEASADALSTLGATACCFALAAWTARRAMSEAAAILAGKHAIVLREDSPRGADFYRLVGLALKGAASVQDAPYQPGKLQEMLRGGELPQPKRPSVLSGDEGVRIEIQGEHAPLVAVASSIFSAGRECHAMLELRYGSHPVPYRCDLNIRSQSARESTARAIKGIWGDDERWPLLIARLVAAIEEWAREDIRPVRWTDLPEQDDVDLIEGLIVDDALTILYGTGSSMKSLVALSAAIAVAAGLHSWMGQRVADHGPILWIDYEDPHALRRRIQMVANGLGIEHHDIPVFLLDPKGQPLIEIGERLREVARSIRPRLVVIDSAMHACAGPPEDASVATGAMRAARGLGAPVLMISHTNRTDSPMSALWGEPDAIPAYPYGNVVWRNLARRTLYQRVLRCEAAYAIEIVEAKSNGPRGFVNGVRLLASFSENAARLARPSWLQSASRDQVRTLYGGRGAPDPE